MPSSRQYKKRAKKQFSMLSDTFQGWAILLKNKQLIGESNPCFRGMGNNPMVGATVAVAVSIEEAAKAGKF